MDLLTKTGIMAVVALAWTATGSVTPMEAQLISPGKLASPHTELEGIRQCTQCHELRQRGVSADKCLACHTPLQTRIQERTGLHASSNASICSDCHRDHLGSNYHMVAFDTAAFVHDSVDYALVDAHAEIGCRDCHTAEHVSASDVVTFKSAHNALSSTFLGLATTCRSCHGDEDPHQKQFPDQACEDCHTERVWDEAPTFDHDSTDYALTGAHRTTPCAECHPSRPLDGATPTMVFTGLAFRRCNDCHRDPHEGAMAKACHQCHSTRAWSQINQAQFEGGFDHDATGFALEGAHADADCSACHTARGTPPQGLQFAFARGTARHRYPRPVVADCGSCHTDYHECEFQETAGGTVCRNCHGQEAWLPTAFGPQRHASETEFALEGRHILVACADCHEERQGRLSFHVDAFDCVSCHADDDPHADQFPESGCAACHTVSGFVPATVDHQATRFPLDGSHQDVPCARCHVVQTINGRRVQRFTPLPMACKDCHA